MHSSRMCTARSSCPRGGVCLSACWDTPPLVWAWRPPPLARPLNFPPGCAPPWKPARHGYHHPPVNRMTERSKILPCPKLRLRAVIITRHCRSKIGAVVTRKGGAGEKCTTFLENWQNHVGGAGMEKYRFLETWKSVLNEEVGWGRNV